MAQSVSKTWLKALESFAADVRISSKEETSTEERGTPLVMWESQKRYLKFIGQGIDDGIHTFYALKSRQLGITTISCIIDVMWCAMHPGLNGCVVTEHEGNREKIREEIVSLVDSFPEGYFGGEFSVVTNNRAMIKFSNGARLRFLVAGTKKKASTAWSEGSGYTFAHLTEVASYGDAAGLESLEESFAQKNPHRLYLYESTAKGFAGPWYARYKDGESDGFTKRSTFLGWWSGDNNRIERKDARFAMYGLEPPDRDERELIERVRVLYDHKVTQEQLAWIRWKNANPSSDETMLLQNHPWTADQAFQTSGFSFFQSRKIGDTMKKIMEDDSGDYAFQAYRYVFGETFFDVKMEMLDPAQGDSLEDADLRVWEEPHPNGKYVIGVDPAYGRTDHGDKSAVSVWRCYADKLVQVAELASKNILARHLAWCIAHLAGAYRDCIVNVELNGPGQIIMPEWDSVRGMIQADMYKEMAAPRDWENAFGNARWYLYHRPDSMGSGYAYNTMAAWKDQQRSMHALKGALATNELLIRSIPLLKEMNNVVQDGQHIGAPDSSADDCKDDLVFAAGLAHLAWTDWQKAGMISEGLAYEKVRDEESGATPVITRSVNAIVANFFKTRQEAEMEPDYRPRWKVERGLE